MNDADIADIIERLRTRFYGKYRGIVTDVDGPTMRIKAKVPSVLGTQETGWCLPCVPYAGPSAGIAFLPEEGAAVWIEFEAGDVSYPIWVGGYWRDGEAPSDAAPKVKVIVTKAGQKITLDDDQGGIHIEDSNGNKITLSSDGIVVEKSSSKIEMDGMKVSINSGALEVQ